MAAPELRLNVSLDLGFFRQQLRQLSAVATSEFNAPLKVKFDKKSLNNEIRLLSNQLSRRKYAIQINDTSIKAARVNAQKLKNTLDLLTKQKYIVNVEYQQKGGPVGTGGGTQRSAGFAAARKEIAGLTAEQLRSRAFQSLGKESRSAQQVSQWLDTVLQQGLKGGAKKKQLDAVRDFLADALAASARSGVEARMRGAGGNGGGGIQRSALDQLARAIFYMAGIDPARVRAEQAERRRIPSLNWEATVPSRAGFAGPSSSGRALPPGVTPMGLPGTAFGSQKYLPTQLGQELREILRGAAFAFVDAVKQNIRQVTVRELPNAVRALAPARIAGMLPSAVGRSPNIYGTDFAGRNARQQETRQAYLQQRIEQAYARSDARSAAIMGRGGALAVRQPAIGLGQPGLMRAPSIPLPPPPGGGGRGPVSGAGGAGGFGRAIGSLNLPGTGMIRELSSEFAFATKQVLLFGQAYKLLAFLQDLPSQVGQAVSQLQSFRNTLNAVSTSAEEARASNELILDLVGRYNIPLQSARDGFTKLYASMAPAGFGGEEIRGLFTGISKAAATFGMSADKVDRVNYAFAQMASKGQVMSEELKGQLGDVLPGAMAIFAQAAGFKGPEAISKFSKELEDGRYKGEAMVALLNNVSIVMNDKFAKGADGAAKTFQGAINNMQTSLKFFYESFEPIAVQFLNGFIRPLSDGLKTVTDGLNAFFTGAAAKTSGGFAIAQELERLRPTFDGLRQNAAQLIQTFGQFAKVALEVGKVLLQIAGNPIVGYLVKLYAIALPINIALNVMRGLWAANALQLVIFNARVNTGTSTLTAFRGMMKATGATAATTAASIRTTGLTLRTFFASTGVGLVLVGISMLIERFMSMNQALEDTKNKALGAAQAIRAMSQTEARQAANQATLDVKLLQAVSQRQQVKGRPGRIAVTEEEKAALERAGISTQTTATWERGFQGIKQTADITQLRGAIEARQGARRAAEYQVRDIKFKEQQSMPDLAPIPAATGDAAGASGKSKKERESQVPVLLLELDTSKQIFDLEREIMTAQLSGNELEVIRLNGLKRQLSINEEIAKVRLKSELPAQEKSLQIQRLMQDAELERLRNAFDLEIKIQEKYDEISKSIIDIGKNASMELEERTQYVDLLKNGMMPALAKTTVEVNKQFAVQLEKMTLLEKDIESQISILSAKKELTKEDEKSLALLRDRLALLQEGKTALPGLAEEAVQSLSQADAPKTTVELISEGIEQSRKNLEELMNIGNQVVGAANAIGDAFGEAFKGIVTGSMSARAALASFFQSISDYFMDMAAKMIAEWIKMQAIQGLANFIGGIFGGGLGGGSIAPGPIAKSAGVKARPGFYGPAFANGGIAMDGFTAFASGGMVTGPTLGLVGEGRYNEAIIPLPNGRSVPVELSGGSGSQIISNITVNVSNGQAKTDAAGSNSNDLGRKLEGAVKQVIVGELRPGGLLAGRR